MASLFEPLVIRGVEFRNRVWVSPMCQYSAIDGVISEWHRIHLGALASGGSGLVFVEATGISPEGRISLGCTGIWNDIQADAFKPLIDFSHSIGNKMGMQLAHAGRKGSTMVPWDDHEIADVDEGGWETVSASPISFRDFPTPHELTEDEILKIVDQFAAAAIRAVNVGFDVIEIHAAHGYLLHQFFSPLSNKRVDSYGGDFQGRIKFLLEVSKKVRSVIPDKTPLFVRISASDWVDGGWDLTQSIELAKILSTMGVDLIDVSSGGLVHDAKIVSAPGYQVAFSESIKRNANILTSAVGLITESQQAEEIVSSGKADAVMLGRAMLRNPRWAMQAAEELGIKISWPLQLERARRLDPRRSPQ